MKLGGEQCTCNPFPLCDGCPRDKAIWAALVLITVDTRFRASNAMNPVLGAVVRVEKILPDELSAPYQRFTRWSGGEISCFPVFPM